MRWRNAFELISVTFFGSVFASSLVGSIRAVVVPVAEPYSMDAAPVVASPFGRSASGWKLTGEGSAL